MLLCWCHHAVAFDVCTDDLLPCAQFRGLFFGARGVEWTGPVVVWCKKTQLVNVSPALLSPHCPSFRFARWSSNLLASSACGENGMQSSLYLLFRSAHEKIEQGRLRRDSNESEEVLYDIHGHWDTKLMLKHSSSGAEKGPPCFVLAEFCSASALFTSSLSSSSSSSLVFFLATSDGFSVLYDYDECHSKDAPRRLQLDFQLPSDSTVRSASLCPAELMAARRGSGGK
eukprot:764066-Hanusia_phi.AAC.2